MAKLNYWERREAQDMYNYMESAEKKADEIAQLYLKASRYISTQADQIFDKYKGKYGLSESEARRLLNELKDKTSLDELLQKLRDGDSNDSRKELRKQLESAAYQARLERLRQLQNQLDFVMMRVYKQELQRNRSFYTDFANEAYYREMYNIQQRAGAAFSFAHISKDTIEEVINSRWSGENYSSRIWKNTKALAQELKEQLLLELVTGKTHREIANEIANKYAAGASRARRLIRTESNYLAGEMSFKAYAAAGIEKYMYLAVLDLKTCTTCCRTLDGKIFYTKDKKVGVNCHPMHPWCRCTEIAVLDEEWLKDMTRKALDPKTHKKIDVPLTLSYAQWYHKYVEGNQDAKLEEKRIRNTTSDRIQYKKYREILGEEIPETLEEFQNMKYNEIEKWNHLKSKKQEALNKMDFDDMGNLIEKLGNKEVRQWYKAHDEKIPDLVDKTIPLEQQARQAFEMRNQYRIQARELMKDQVSRKELDIKHKNRTFEELLEHKRKKYGLTESEAYKDIIRSSTTTNKKYDKIAGIQ